MKNILLAIALILSLSACSSHNDAVEALQALGMKDIETTGYRFFGCPKDDSFHTGFVATNPQGQRVSGVVCSGWIMGGTVRFD